MVVFASESRSVDLETEVRTFLRDRIGAVFDVASSAVPFDAELSSFENFDSIKLYELVIEIEKRFKVTLPDEEVFELRSVTELCDFVIARIVRASSDPGPTE